MAALTIENLRADCTLGRKTMASVTGRGGGAPWVYGWISPYIERASSGFVPVINFYVNIFVADQMNNQIQVFDVRNSAANANINVAANQAAGNFKQ